METQNASVSAQPTPAPATHPNPPSGPGQATETQVPSGTNVPANPNSEPTNAERQTREFLEKSHTLNDNWRARAFGQAKQERPPQPHPDFFQGQNNQPPTNSPEASPQTPQLGDVPAGNPSTPGNTPAVSTDVGQPTQPVASAEKPPESSAPVSYKFNLNGFEAEYSRDEVHQALQYAVAAHSRESEIQQRENQIQTLYRQVQELENHPDMQMLRMIQSDKELRNKIKTALQQEAPQAAVKQDFAERDHQVQTLLDRITGLENTLKTQSEQAAANAKKRQEAEEASARDHQNRQFIADVNARVQPLAQQYEIPPEVLDGIGWRAYQAVLAKALPPTVDGISGFFLQEFQKHQAFLGAQVEKVRGQYLQEKNRAPVPPPPSGGVPVIAPRPSGNWNKTREAATAYLEAFDRMGQR
jgi:hypothetical protein